MKRILAVLATLCLTFLTIAPVAMSQAPFVGLVFPPQTVMGNPSSQSGFGQAIPFARLTATLFGLTIRGNADYTILSTDYTIVTNAAFTAPRTWTLPAASTITSGKSICVYDAFGGVNATNTLTVVRTGADTISGGTSIVADSPFYIACFTSDGSSKFTAEKSPLNPTFTQTGTGAVQQTLDAWAKQQHVHLSDFGGVADGTAISTGTVSITTGTGALTVTAATFTSADVGKIIRVDGAAAASSQYFGTITVFTSGTQVTVSPNAGTTLTTAALGANAQVVYGTDNATALQNWINRCQSSAETCMLNQGAYAFGSTLNVTNALTVWGHGRQSSILYPLNPSITEISINTNNPVRLSSFAMWGSTIAGISNTFLSITGSTQNYGSVLDDLYWIGGNTQVACTNCQNLRIDKATMINAINNGIVLGNANSPLSGQYFISNSEFALFQTASVRQSCITLQSGGNLVIASSMVHFCNVGLHVQQNNGTLLGDIFITGSSFEQSDNAGIIFDKGTSTTVQTIQIVGNDFGGGTPSGIVVNGATAFLQDMSIQGNTFYPNNSSAIILPNGASLGDGAITITGNVFATGGGTPTGINVTGNAVKGMAAGNTFRGLTTNVANASPFFLAENLVNGHTSYVGVAPTLTAGCNGAGQVTTGATDRSGTITGQTTAHTTCTLTFAQAYAVAPSCVAMGISSPLTTTAVSTTTTLVVNFANTANFKWTYWCPGT